MSWKPSLLSVIFIITFIYRTSDCIVISECKILNFMDNTTGLPITNVSTVLLSQVSKLVTPLLDQTLHRVTELLMPIKNLLGPSPETTNVAYTVYPKNANDVVQSLQSILNTKRRPTVKSGGHCFSDWWSNNPNGTLMDLSSMKKIYKSEDGIIWIEPGNMLFEVYFKLYEQFGLTAPGGVCMTVGMGGHVLGGGYGFLLRGHGLLADFVHTFEIAVVDENRKVQLIRIGRNSTDPKDQDLFWALRGAGNQNFGIVTKIGFQDLPQSPPKVYVYRGLLTLNVDLPHDKFINFMMKYSQFFADNSNTSNKYCDLYVMMTPVRELHVATIIIDIIAFGENNYYLADDFIQYVGLNDTLDLFVCLEMSYYSWQTLTLARDLVLLKEYKEKIAMMNGPFSSKQVETMWSYLTAPEHNIVNGWIALFTWGCALGNVAVDATPMPHRDTIFSVSIFTLGTTGINDLNQREQWKKGFYGDMFGSAENPPMDNSMDGSLYSYADDDLTDWQQLYFKDNYPRLQKIKAEWDPKNIFWHRQSIEVSSS